MKWPAKKLWILLLITLAACGKPMQEDEFQDCEYLEPEAIFSSNIEGISNHHFSLDGQKGQESLVLPNGTKLSIIQTGCHFRRQDFQFTLPFQLEEKREDPNFWPAQVIEQLNLLSQLGPEFVSFRHWAKAIVKKASQIQVGDTVALQPGFYVKIDHQVTENRTILVLTLSDQL